MRRRASFDEPIDGVDLLRACVAARRGDPAGGRWFREHRDLVVVAMDDDPRRSVRRSAARLVAAVGTVALKQRALEVLTVLEAEQAAIDAAIPSEEEHQ